MGKVFDLAGQRFGRLTVIEFAGIHEKAKQATWKCACDCGEARTIRGWSLRSGNTVSCGCYGGPTQRNPKQLEMALLERRQITTAGCWEWTGTLNNMGYGKMGIPDGPGRSKLVYAHRLAAHLWTGFDLKSDAFVCHRCDNPKCFNPEHLFVGTPLDNTRDAISKGRIVPKDKYKHVTHCKRGHEYKEVDGRKHCRICRREPDRLRQREIRRKKREALANQAAT